jgi:hypothetical protein
MAQVAPREWLRTQERVLPEGINFVLVFEGLEAPVLALFVVPIAVSV